LAFLTPGPVLLSYEPPWVLLIAGLFCGYGVDFPARFFFVRPPTFFFVARGLLGRAVPFDFCQLSRSRFASLSSLFPGLRARPNDIFEMLSNFTVWFSPLCFVFLLFSLDQHTLATMFPLHAPADGTVPCLSPRSFVFSVPLLVFPLPLIKPLLGPSYYQSLLPVICGLAPVGRIVCSSPPPFSSFCPFNFGLFFPHETHFHRGPGGLFFLIAAHVTPLRTLLCDVGPFAQAPPRLTPADLSLFSLSRFL